MLNDESEDILLGEFESMASDVFKNQVKNDVRVGS